MMIMWKQILTKAVDVKMSLTQSMQQKEEHSPPLEETHRHVEVICHYNICLRLNDNLIVKTNDTFIVKCDL